MLEQWRRSKWCLDPNRLIGIWCDPRLASKQTSPFWPCWWILWQHPKVAKMVPWSWICNCIQQTEFHEFTWIVSSCVFNRNSSMGCDLLLCSTSLTPSCVGCMHPSIQTVKAQAINLAALGALCLTGPCFVAAPNNDVIVPFVSCLHVVADALVWASI